MAVLRLLVEDVDESIAAFMIAGFRLVDRWGPPFAILAAGNAKLWVSGPQTSAAALTAQLDPSVAAGSRVRPVHEVDDVDSAVANHLADGWSIAAGPVTGPGGSQALLRRGSAFLEVFAGR